MRYHVPKSVPVALALGVIVLAVLAQLAVRQLVTPDARGDGGQGGVPTSVARGVRSRAPKTGLATATTPTSVRFGDAVPVAERMAALALVTEVEDYWREEAGVAVRDLRVALGVDFEDDLAPVFAEWERTSVPESIQSWRLIRWSGYTSYWYQHVQNEDVVSRHIYAHIPAQSWRDLTSPDSPLRTILVHEYFHQVQDQLDRAASAGGVPDWILEGSAHYAEYRHVASIGGDTSEQESHLVRTGMTDLAALQTCDVGECHESELYWAGAAAIAWLNDRTRPSAYIDFWRESGRTGDWREAFLRTYGMTIETFYQQFDEFQAGRRLAKTVALSGVLTVDGSPPPVGKWVVQACYTNLIQDCVASPVKEDGQYELRVAPRWLNGRETSSVTVTASARVGCTIFPVAPTVAIPPPEGIGTMGLALDGGSGRRDFQIRSDAVQCLTGGLAGRGVDALEDGRAHGAPKGN